MDEAQHLADRVIVMARGQIVAQGPPSTIGGRSGESVIAFRLPLDRDGSARPLPTGLPADGDERADRVELRTTHPTEVLHRLTSWAVDGDIELEGLTVTRPSLEDVYLELTSDDG